MIKKILSGGTDATLKELPKKSYKQLYFSPTDERIVEKRRKKAFGEVVYLLPAEYAGEETSALSYYDRMIADAAYTLMRREVTTIFAKSIMEVLSGNEALTLRPDRKQEVEESMSRLAALRVVPSARPYGRAAFYAADASGEEETPWFPVQKKKTGFAYDPAHLPQAYVRAEQRGLLIRAPQHMFAASGLPTSLENLAIAHYIYVRIALRQKVRFAELCRELDIHFPEGAYYRERKEATIRQKAETIIQAFRASGMKIPRMMVELQARTGPYDRT